MEVVVENRVRFPARTVEKSASAVVSVALDSYVSGASVGPKRSAIGVTRTATKSSWNAVTNARSHVPFWARRAIRAATRAASANQVTQELVNVA